MRELIWVYYYVPLQKYKWIHVFTYFNIRISGTKRCEYKTCNFITHILYIAKLYSNQFNDTNINIPDFCLIFILLILPLFFVRYISCYYTKDLLKIRHFFKHTSIINLHLLIYYCVYIFALLFCFIIRTFPPSLLPAICYLLPSFLPALSCYIFSTIFQIRYFPYRFFCKIYRCRFFFYSFDNFIIIL